MGVISAVTVGEKVNGKGKSLEQISSGSGAL
jgi:hypothetical protein